MLHFMLISEVVERINNHASIGAVPNVNRRRTHPCLKVIYRKGDVLCVGSVEDPNLPVGGRSRDAMPVIMEQDSLFLRVTSQRHAQLLHVVDGWVKRQFVAGFWLPPLVLLL